MSMFAPKFPKLRIRIPSHRRTLGDAARLERDVLLILRDVFPEASEWIATGEPRKPVAIALGDEAAFIDTIVKLRRTGPRADFRDEASRFYTPDSVPHLYTTKNGYYTPSPRRPLSPHPDESISWSARFSLGRAEAFYEQVEIFFPFAIGESRGEAVRVEMLFERLVQRTDPEDARYAIVNFDKPFWETNHRIGWLTYLSQPSLVEHLRADPRARPFHRGLILKLSDDPADMMDDNFVSRSFEFAQKLVPYWPAQLDN